MSETLPEHEHWYLLGARRCGFTVDAGRCDHTPASETPGPGEGALRGEDVTTELLTGALGEIDRLRDAIRDIDAGRVRDVDEVRRERDAAVEQCTLAEQKVARVEAAAERIEQHAEMADVSSAGRHLLRWAAHKVHAALADPEADR